MIRYSKKLMTAALLAAVLLSALVFPASAETSFDEIKTEAAKYYYVSPDGDDTAAGTLDAPFATIERARDAIRELAESTGLPDGGITVYLRGGEYKVSETLKFTSKDSGTEACPIKYASYEGERAYIDGGYTLDPTKFVTPSDEILARMLTDDAKVNLREYDLAAAGVDCSEILKEGQHGAIMSDSRLYIGGTRCWQGRYPNDNRDVAYVFFGEIDGMTYTDVDERIKNWAPESIETARLYGNFEIDWIAASAKVESYDAETNKVTVSGDTLYPQGRYFYYNVLEEVDVPYEYFIDQSTGKLYVYLTDDMLDEKISFALLRGDLVNARVSNYTFENITFENGVDDLVDIKGDNNSFIGCEIRCGGEDGLNSKGNNFVFDSNEIYSVGSWGMTVKGGEAARLIYGGNEITNNRIHDFGELNRVYQGAISVGSGIGYTVAHNEIYYGPHMAIGYTGKDLVMEYNHIHDVCYESGDAGAVYVYGGSWIANGMIFRHNLVENINCKMSPYYTPTAVYIDASTGGVQIYSNIIKNVDGWGVLVRGMDNVVRDNILIDASIYMDCAAYYKLPGKPNAGWSADENGPISVFPSGMLWRSILGADEYATKEWAYRYPWTMLIKTTNVYDLTDRFVPYAFGDMSIRQNIICPSMREMYICPEPDESLLNVRDNYYLDNMSDLGLADVENGDYSMSHDSKIYHLIPGFNACDFDSIGVIEDNAEE